VEALESAHESTTLQRVVTNRSGECPPVIVASGVTGAEYVIYVFVRQVLNLPAASLICKAPSIRASTNFSGKDGAKFAENLMQVENPATSTAATTCRPQAQKSGALQKLIAREPPMVCVRTKSGESSPFLYSTLRPTFLLILKLIPVTK
jgi:hypothetical protein